MTKSQRGSDQPALDTTNTATPQRELPPEAVRALVEAEARRRLREQEANIRPKEINGQKGPDPARYGDWEKDGIVSDF